MPNGDFEKQLAEWEKETQLYQEQARASQLQITDYGKQMEALTPKQPTTLIERIYAAGRPLIMEWGPLYPSPAKDLIAKRFIRENISQAALDLERNDFFARLYSEVPIAISAGLVASSDEVLAMLSPPSDLTADELSEVVDTISNMIAVITAPPGALEPEELEYPPLVAPVPVARVPVSMHQLSTQELLKSLKTPRTPESAMTTAEWEEFLRLKGYTDEDIDKEQQLLAEELINSWADRNSQLAAFKSSLAEMPEYKLTDMLKEMVVQPGLALAEVGMVYFEHVSMPLAGKIYKNFIPDLEAEYQRFKTANPNATDREALVHAWHAWDAPFEGAAEWILKYMLMEGLVDPLTYVGWGIATRLTKPIPYFGRLVGAAEKGLVSVLELPFDGMKWAFGKVPKTLTQRATFAQNQASQYVERYLTKSTGRHLSSMSMKDFTEASERAIKYALNNPQLEDDIALAGKEMLKHTPVNEAVTKDWGTRLGTTLRSEDITKVTVENVENLFEDMFARKLITPREAAGQLLKVLNVGDMSDATLKTAQRILETRATRIQTSAIAFTRAKTPLAAMRDLASKNFKAHIVTEESAAALVRKETGAFSSLLHNTDLKLQGIWRNGIDRWVVRPFAEAYLTFGMYGPMNVLEDYIRSTLGGVFPRRMNIEAWEKLTIGLKVDPELKRYGISEMLGPLAREGPKENWNNWILQLAALGQRRWADKIYQWLVRIPGAFGMDVRRNFMSKRYLQLIAEAGGEEFKALAKAGPKLPKLVNRQLLKDLESTVYSLKTTGSPDAIRGAKDLFTRKRVLRNEVSNILSEHPELPNTARDYIMRAFDEDIIFRDVVAFREVAKDIIPLGPNEQLLYHQTNASEAIMREGFIVGKGGAVMPGTGVRWNMPGVYLKSQPAVVRPDTIGRQQLVVKANIKKPIEFNTWADFDAWKLQRGITHTEEPMFLDKVVPGSATAKELELEWKMTIEALDKEGIDAVVILRDIVPGTKSREFIKTTLVIDPKNVKPIARMSGFDAQLKKLAVVDKKMEMAFKKSAKEAGEEYVPGRFYGTKGIEAYDALVKQRGKIFNDLKAIEPTIRPEDISSPLSMNPSDSIDSTIRETRDILLDDFIRGPEVATQQYHQLADFLTALEVRNPQEMAIAIQAVHKMSEIYGALPEQIIAQATIRSRGLPIAERRATFDADFDRIYTFLDAAGADIDRVVNKLRLTATEPTKLNKVNWEVVEFGSEILKTPALKDTIIKIVDALPLDIKLGVKHIQVNRKAAEVLGAKAYWSEVDELLVFRGVKDITPEIVYHEIAHIIEAKILRGTDREILARFAELTGHSVEATEIRSGLWRPIGYKPISEGFATDFSVYIREPERLSGDIEKFFSEYFPKTQREIPFSEGYKNASVRLFDIMTTKREYATEFRAQNMATRSEIFAGISKKEMTPDFWDSFYNQMSNDYRIFNTRMAELDGQLVKSIEEMNIAAGAKITPRAPVVVKDRPLAPQDIATLLGVRGDDISRALLDVLTVQNNKEFFTTYVQAMARPGDIGFTKESIGAVYDQLAYSLRVTPETMSWITSKQLELDAVRKELHSLYNGKMLPDEEIAAIGKYVDGTADAVEKLMFETPVIKPFVVKAKPLVDDAAGADLLRQNLTNVSKNVSTGENWAPSLADAVQQWRKHPENDVLQLIGRIASGSKGYRSEVLKILKSRYPLGYIKVFRGHGQAGSSIQALKREFLNVTSSVETARGFGSLKWLTPDGSVNSITIKIDDVVAIGTAGESELIVKSSVLKDRISKFVGEAPAPPTKLLKSEYANFDDLRQSAMDEAHKWYYKEYPDYTNANAFDAMMKTIYPYWTYESQRWFWLPRSFVRHPGLFTTFERWQNNSDYGYIHIPNTSVDINPFRGTIFGSLTTRLTRRDFPEYFDSLQAAKGMIEFNDYLSRFGFYPGAHISIPLSLLGGSQAQLGETVPAILKTPLDALVALYPESESVKWLSDRVFSDRFRDYMTIIEANKRGYNGSYIWSKLKEGRKLTDEEEAVWFESRSEAAFYSAGFNQFGLFRLRTSEQYRAYEESAKVIEEITGYTPDQQDWLRRHSYRIWDMVGGISPTNQAILQQLESFKWLGSVTPLLPSRQQQELTKLDIDWADVTQFAESGQAMKLQLQQDFLSGVLGPRDYNKRLQAFYSDQRTYIDKKMEENPNMTLEGRKEYYKKYGIPIPVQHPMRELLNLYFSIELQDKHDEETGELIVDWDTFFAQREAIEDAIPEDLKGEWEDYLSRNTTRVEEVRRDVSSKYFRKYYDVWEASLTLFPENEQKIINEFLYLERTGQQLQRQAEIKEVISSKTGLQLISSFRSDVSDNRASLRYANPHLDAWLFYWGRTTSFKTPQAEAIYRQIAKDTGRQI